MNRGVVLFAFNSPEYNYLKMAEFTAKRVNHFLNLPVTLITDKSSIISLNHPFDKIITVESDPNNIFQGRIWLNKGRYQCFNLTPYDETLLLDVDYMINSNRLLQVFDVVDDFCCHEHVSFLMDSYNKIEKLNNDDLSLSTLWATVVCFKKTNRVKQIFECLEMVQKNYEHYGQIHKFSTDTYRNDYALTLAWYIANGHSYNCSDIIPWNLMHIGLKTYVYKNNDTEFNTEYTVIYDKWLRGKIKKEYITIKDMDFHIINKDIFLELASE